MKVNKTTDGKFAIVEREQVTRNIAIWSPVDERRFDTEESATMAMWELSIGIKEQPTIVAKPKVTIDRSHLPLRSDLRITKLAKGVFVIERKKFGKWEECKTTKTLTKAEEWCAVNSRS